MQVVLGAQVPRRRRGRTARPPAPDGPEGPPDPAEGGSPRPPAAGDTGRRAHLDGLRAVAVYLVVAFHAGADRFSGGFIGVDAFFVLSGYLVTQVLLRDVAGSGSIRFGRFYSRRVRRLLPAAVVALLATAVVYGALATPAQRIDVAPGFRACFLYVANWFFIGRSTSYFADPTQQSPVLHFWSLAVEEQFYVVWPLLLAGLVWATARFGRRRWSVLRLCVLGGALASVGAALALRVDHPDRAYFGTDTRAYQLLAGAGLALTPALVRFASERRWVSRVGAPAGLLGLLVLATDRVSIDPIERGIAVTVAVGLLLVALDAEVGGLTKRALSVEALAYLGRISYGTYLWHWPVIVVITMVTHVSPLPLAALTALLASGLAALSSQLLEVPIRAARSLDRFRWPVVASGLAVSLLAGVLVAPGITRASGDRTSTATANAVGFTPVPASFDQGKVFDEKFGKTVDCVGKPPSDCTVVRGTGAKVLLMGDSNAQMWIPAFTELARTEHLTLSLAVDPGCLWQRNVYWLSREIRAQCKRTKTDAYERVIPALDPDLIVLVNTREQKGPARATFDPADDFDQLLRADTPRSLDLLAAPGRKLLIIEPAPTPDDDTLNPLSCLGRARYVEECRFVVPDFSNWLVADERAIAARSKDVATADFTRLICPFFPICDPIVNGIPVFWNGRHISAAYSRSLAGTVGQNLEDQDLLP